MNSENYYKIRINLALAHINTHLGQKIKINDLAKAAGFSPFHFQRIYKIVQGETPYETILRLRLERSLTYLKYHQLSISQLAYECGFESLENFSRQFKARFKVSPSGYRKDKALQNSRIYQEPNPEDYYLEIEKSRAKKSAPFKVFIEDFEAMRVAFIRATFGADGSGLMEAYLHLMEWAAQEKISEQGQLRRFGQSIDQVEATPTGKFRYDFLVAIPDGVKGKGLIEIGEIPAGKYASVYCKGKLDRVSQAWDYLYRDWLMDAKYVPENHPAIEEFLKGPEEIGWENFDLKCSIPIRKSRS